MCRLTFFETLRLYCCAFTRVVGKAKSATSCMERSTAARSASTVKQLALFHQPVPSHKPVVELYHCCRVLAADFAWAEKSEEAALDNELVDIKSKDSVEKLI